MLPPDQYMSMPPLFHQLLPLSTTALKSTGTLVGMYCLMAAFTLLSLQFARRLLSSPQQPNALVPQIGVLGTCRTQMLKKLR